MVRRAWALAAALVVVAATGCGQADDDSEAAPQAPAAATPASVTVDPASAAADTGGARRKVLEELEKFNSDHQGLTDLYVETFGPFPADDQRIDDAIASACEAKAAGFKPSGEEIGMVTMYLGSAITAAGSDVLTYMSEVMARDKRIAELVDCAGVDTSTTTVAPPAAAPTTTAPPEPERATRQAPAQIGETITLKNRDDGDVDVTVVSFAVDATATVLAENPYSPAPDPGTRYSLLGVSGTYHAGVSKSTSQFGFAVRLSLFGLSAKEISESSCSAPVPGALDSYSDLLDGGTVTGNVCFAVPDADAGGPLLLRVSEFVCFANCDEAWFKLQ